MQSRVKIYVVLTVSSIITIVFLLYNFEALKKIYLIASHKSGIVGHFNGNGKLDGEVDTYLNGKIAERTNLKNGSYDGWKVVYYPNGNIKTKLFYKENKIEGVEFNYYNNGKIKSRESFKDGKYEGPKITYYQKGQIEQSSFRKNGKVEGVEYAYYENGKLKYKRNWVNDKPYGDSYFYYEDGKVKIYHAYDILGEKFYLSLYDESGKLFRSDGDVFSDNVYSKDIGRDSLVVLKNNNKYNGIRDLYITVSNPPHISTATK